MELKKQVCSLELAKKLKELGVKQESLWAWEEFYSITNDSYISGTGEYVIKDNREYLTTGQEVFKAWYRDWTVIHEARMCAFTVAELGEMLPWDIVVARNIDKEWIITFQANGLTEDEVASYKDFNEANARAMMLIYLIDNKLLTL